MTIREELYQEGVEEAKRNSGWLKPYKHNKDRYQFPSDKRDKEKDKRVNRCE